jgi:hypothetical protein
MHLIDPLALGVSKEQADAINNHLVRVFVYGVITYRVFGADHRFCYAHELPIRDGPAGRYLEAGGPAYHCDT